MGHCLLLIWPALQDQQDHSWLYTGIRVSLFFETHEEFIEISLPISCYIRHICIDLEVLAADSRGYPIYISCYIIMGPKPQNNTICASHAVLKISMSSMDGTPLFWLHKLSRKLFVHYSSVLESTPPIEQASRSKDLLQIAKTWP